MRGNSGLGPLSNSKLGKPGGKDRRTPLAAYSGGTAEAGEQEMVPSAAEGLAVSHRPVAPWAEPPAAAGEISGTKSSWIAAGSAGERIKEMQISPWLRKWPGGVDIHLEKAGGAPGTSFRKPDGR